ncbi:MAG: HAMP domain-containing histidine kinase [Spirochaetales bacterium]|jgi:signal transduction histidine kinase|nr:HAMP domain-containing histidine kinase [Spirochaetales bacterium]
MKLRKRLPAILLIFSLIAMAGVGVGLHKWLDGVKDLEAQRIQGDLANGAGRIQSDIALEFSAIATLLSYAGEGEKSDFHLSEIARNIPEVYSKWREATRFPRLIKNIFYITQPLESYSITPFSVSGKVLAEKSDLSLTITPELTSAGQLFKSETGLHRLVLYIDGLALVLPILRYSDIETDNTTVDFGGKNMVVEGYIIAEIDREYLAEDVVTKLKENYLGRLGRYSHMVMNGNGHEVLGFSDEGDRISIEEITAGKVDARVLLTPWIDWKSILPTEELSGSAPKSAALSLNLLSLSYKDLFFRQWFALKATAMETSRPRINSTVDGSDEAAESNIVLYFRYSGDGITKSVVRIRNRRLAIAYSVLMSFAFVALVFFLLYRRARELWNREHEFVATVTHELRTPVAGVNAVADNLAAGIVSEPHRVKEYGKAILDHGRRLRDLIDQVLFYAGMSESKMQDTLEGIDLDPFVRKAAGGASVLPSDRLIIHVNPSLNRYRCDPFAVETVISNLVSNAAKHAGRNVTVTVNVSPEIRRGKSWLIIRISDTGRGIPKRELSRVIMPFYRGDVSRAEQIPGSGLGLSLINRVVRAYHGKLSINSTIDLGTSVTVRLLFEQGNNNGI